MTHADLILKALRVSPKDGGDTMRKPTAFWFFAAEAGVWVMILVAIIAPARARRIRNGGVGEAAPVARMLGQGAGS